MYLSSLSSLSLDKLLQLIVYTGGGFFNFGPVRFINFIIYYIFIYYGRW